MDNLKNFVSFSKRIPQDKEIGIQKHRENNFNDDTYKNLSIVVGNSQQGKDTFICSLDQNLLKSQKIQIGDGNNSCTSKLDLLHYRCPQLIGLNQGIVLNTIGLGDSSVQKNDSEIVTEIYEFFLREVSQICGGVHTFYFVQGLDATPVNQIERTLIYMQAALGKEIFKSSVIIATKGNKIDDDELEEKINSLKGVADKYQIKGGVIDYRCPYMKTVKKKQEYGISVTDEEFANTQQELYKCLMGLEFFEMRSLMDKLTKEIEDLKKQIKENSKYTIEKDVRKERKERKWQTLWLVEHTVTYYEKQYEICFNKTDSKILEEAMERCLQKSIINMKEYLSKLNSQQMKQQQLIHQFISL